MRTYLRCSVGDREEGVDKIAPFFAFPRASVWVLLGLAALLAPAMQGCSTQSPNARREEWDAPLTAEFDAERWRGTSAEELHEPKNQRRSMVGKLLERSWKGSPLVDVLQNLGNPDFLVRREELSTPPFEKVPKNARLAICYRFAVAGDGEAAYVYFFIGPNGKVQDVGRRF